ncbi:MAG: tetratricopeptide repeat protein [Acidobacteria bacterium]|nr:tetratricopeptide repeat protein [Acidobacteriota bacterium]MCA1627770.1 tetratricopeptide repeat protein [Acidobacteriota bacterium]
MIACTRVCLCLVVFALVVQAQPAAVTITSEPNAIVWIDEVRRGTTDASGKLTISKLSPGRHTVRVRKTAFKEATAVLLPGRRTLSVKLVGTDDPAVLMFQQAEKAREEARDDASRENAAELYREALKNPPPNASARVGVARVLLDLNKFKEARAEIDAARRIRPVYPEASAVEGRIYLEEGFTDDAIRSFRRSIREANGFQPEAHVGLARVYEEKGEFALAIAELRKALAQLDDSEPVIYQMLGAAYEKINKPKEAIVAYEKYLQLAPNGSYAAALRSIVNQLKRGADGEEIIP